MVRKISLQDLENAVVGAYEEYKSDKEGQIDPRVADSDPKAYGIAVMLTDGTVVKKGDTKVKAAMGEIAGLALHSVLLQQYGVDELIKKAGKTSCHCLRKMDLPVCAHGVRAVSAVLPQNDPDGKYDIILNNLLNMTTDAPVFDDKLYELLEKESKDADVENKLASVDYTLYDDAQGSIAIFNKLQALTLDAEQLATIGATIAADGVNPATKQVVFDGVLSAPLVAVAASHGKPDRVRRWMMTAGVPAVTSFSGLVLAIMPGVGAIAAYSPEVCSHSQSKKARKAITYITNKLGYNVFGSAKVEIEK